MQVEGQVREEAQDANERKQLWAEILKELVVETDTGGATQRKKAPHLAYAPAQRSLPYEGIYVVLLAVTCINSPATPVASQDNMPLLPRMR